jgi:hypothetical protein
VKKIKLNRHERKKLQQERLKVSLSGTGVYIYENNTNADLSLSRPTAAGIKTVGPRKRFEGDSYYMKWVGPPINLLRLIEQVLPKEAKENEMSDKKLILDQPDVINNQGKVEQVVSDQTPQQDLNDNTNIDSKKPDVLLNESPVDGVEIIFG